ncbi:hypothetical protein CPLU01_04415 [Colletotrichum plurivorum]|uniref:Uncharacterized protein n=1 Tax=Colletotrichum plurivorum TaxID=2175906 RepID=A0A8H6KQF8_9PEZI|nr:hypothetical protein CPLU01_04415 [Colletotrichum plurivorum]
MNWKTRGWFPSATIGNLDYDEIKSTADLLISQGLTRDEAITEIASRLNAEAGADADDFDFDDVKEDNDADWSEAYDPLEGLTHSFDQKLNYFGTEWFDTQWHEVDGYFDGDVISPFQDVSDIGPPTFRLTKKRWTPKEIKTRSHEALRQIMNFWPTKAFQVHGQWVRAIVIPPNRSHAPNEYESIFHVGVAKKLLQRHKRIRALVQERSRPHLRPLNLNNIPHEIVGRISAFQVEDDSSRDHISDFVRNVDSLTFAIRSAFLAEPLRNHGLEDRATQGEEDLAGLDSFLDPLLSSEHLSTLNVNLESLRLANEEVEDGWHLPSLMKARPWPKLRHMELANVSLDSGKLADFLGNKPLYIRTLDEPRMEHGTWTEALDVMRERYDAEWRQTDSLDKLRGLSIFDAPWHASGAECDEMEDDDYDRTFGTPPDGWPQKNGRDCYDGYRLAEKYVRRELDDNPCRQYL